VKYLWALIGLLYALLNIYTGYVLFTAGTGARLAQKGIMLQARPSWAASPWPSSPCH